MLVPITQVAYRKVLYIVFYMFMILALHRGSLGKQMGFDPNSLAQQILGTLPRGLSYKIRKFNNF